MKYAVVITDTAKQDLREIAMWIAKQSKDIEIAKRFVNELRERCQELYKFPSTGSFPRDHVLKSMGYRFVTHKEYLIFYLIDEENKIVNVMAIFNAKKDYMRVMRNFI